MCAIRAPRRRPKKPRDAEGERLVAVEPDAVAARGDVVVADRAQAAPEMRAEQTPSAASASRISDAKRDP